MNLNRILPLILMVFYSPLSYAEFSQDTETAFVQRGETLQEVSQRLYGTTRRWKEIADLNKKHLPNPDVLLVGMKLVVSNQGLKNSATTANSPSPVIAKSAGTVNGPTEIIIQPGDSLVKIAAQYLGGEGKWRKLLKWNSKTITDPSKIIAGMKLQLIDEPTQVSVRSVKRTKRAVASVTPPPIQKFAAIVEEITPIPAPELEIKRIPEPKEVVAVPLPAFTPLSKNEGIRKPALTGFTEMEVP